jgi:hypothetical protein
MKRRFLLAAAPLLAALPSFFKPQTYGMSVYVKMGAGPAERWSWDFTKGRLPDGGTFTRPSGIPVGPGDMLSMDMKTGEACVAHADGSIQRFAAHRDTACTKASGRAPA